MLTKPQLIELIKDRILILDGAMGTEIQRHNLGEADFKGEEYYICAENMVLGIIKNGKDE